MEERLKQLERLPMATDQPASTPGNVTAYEVNGVSSSKGQGLAWRLVDTTAWQPCPFGLLPDGRLPSLDHRVAVAV